jgi:hypothetical protein
LQPENPPPPFPFIAVSRSSCSFAPDVDDKKGNLNPRKRCVENQKKTRNKYFEAAWADEFSTSLSIGFLKRPQ